MRSMILGFPSKAFTPYGNGAMILGFAIYQSKVNTSLKNNVFFEIICFPSKAFTPYGNGAMGTGECSGIN